jgi:hypothetical protein
MAKLNWQNEDSGEVFLRGNVRGKRGRGGSVIQKLDSPTFLPGSDFRRDSELPGRGNFFDYRLYGRLHRNGLRHSSEEIRPLGRRVAERLHYARLLNNLAYGITK